MGKLAQKIFPLEALREKVTIRVLPEKMQIYPRFKELVTEQLGSDVCFVTTSLWEAFLQAMDQNPPAINDPIEMKFMRQNVQINIGCQILYQPKKARRTPGTFLKTDKSFPFYVEKDRGHLLPGFLDQWDHMSEKSKSFWLQRLQEKGIIPHEEPPAPPSVSTPARDKPLKKFFKTLYNSMTIVSGWVKRKLWSD